MLLGQHLGRGHQGALVTTLHRGEQGRHGDDGLAGADVSLQEAVHRVRRGEVGLDLTDRPGLRRGERIRERVVEPADEFATDLVRQPTRRPFEFAFAEHEGELHPQ